MKTATRSCCLLVAVFAAAMTAGCASEPYYLGRTTASDSGKFQQQTYVPQKDPWTKQPYFSICYNKLLHSAEQVRALVKENCSDPQLYQNITDLYNCSLEAPVRATYSCTALSRAASEARPNLLPTGSYTGTINLY